MCGGEDTFRICKLRADLSSIPKSKFEKRKSASPGKPDKYILNYSVEMTMDSAAISFRMVIDGQYLSPSSLVHSLGETWADLVVIGVEYGSVKTEFV